MAPPLRIEVYRILLRWQQEPHQKRISHKRGVCHQYRIPILGLRQMHTVSLRYWYDQPGVGLLTCLKVSCSPSYSPDYVESYCCLYSRKIGCQVALNPSTFNFEKHAGTYCDKCRKHCICTTTDSSSGAAPRHRFWDAVRLLGIVALLSAFLSSLMEAVCFPAISSVMFLFSFFFPKS